MNDLLGEPNDYANAVWALGYGFDEPLTRSQLERVGR
jgi:hypothetical protein